MAWDYQRLKSLVADVSLPAMLVDLDILESNTRKLAGIARGNAKKLRVASKSVRVPALLKRITEIAGDVLAGLMCYSVAEARFLAGEGFDHLLIAYPTVQRQDIESVWEMTQAGTDVTLMVDSLAHIERIERVCEAGHTPVRVCIDVDMAYRTAGMHIGVQRSPIRSLDEFGKLVKRITRSRHVKLHGVMGYEAQVAGMGESNPFTPVLNPLKRLIKSRSVRDVRKQRKAFADWLEREGLSMAIFNGGGTGSIRSTSQEPWITEVTAGSGFLQSHLFDYYRSNQNQPAFCFGLMVMRKPQDNVVTCQSGGFIASGEAGPDKQPLPFLPEGLRATRLEGFGEVQTPLIVSPGLDLRPGDPVFFRPAKAGEIAERFDEYLLVSKGEIIERPRTYRGLGHCFF